MAMPFDCDLLCVDLFFDALSLLPKQPVKDRWLEIFSRCITILLLECIVMFSTNGPRPSQATPSIITAIAVRSHISDATKRDKNDGRKKHC